MKAICENELVIDCTGYKAIDTGVVLFDDEDQSTASAFVPSGKLEFLLPDDVVEREHERLGVPAPEVASTSDLESRLDEFADEVEELRGGLDRLLEDGVDAEGAPDETTVEREDRLRERRRTVDRSLQQVRRRAQQLRQLSTAHAETASEPATDEPEAPTETDAESARAEMDDRLQTIEARLEELVAPEAGGDPGGSGADLDAISGLGATYQSRLRDAGIGSVEALLDRDVAEIAEIANVSESRVQTWLDQGSELVESRE